MTKKFDIKDEYGGKVGELHQRTDFGDTASSWAGSILGALIFGIFVLAWWLLVRLFRLTARYPLAMLPIFAVLLIGGGAMLLNQQQ